MNAVVGIEIINLKLLINDIYIALWPGIGIVVYLFSESMYFLCEQFHVSKENPPFNTFSPTERF